MKRLIMVVCLVSQILISSAGADEKPAQAGPGRYFPTLQGMPVPSSVPAVGTLKGSLQTSDGKPLAGADLFFFNVALEPAPAPDKYWRVPDELAKLDDKGDFSVELPPGRYYIGAVQRKAVTTIIDPPSDGDLFYFALKTYEVFSGLVNNLGVISGAKPFSRAAFVKRAGSTAIEGKVIDAAGQPVANALVSSYINSTITGRPLFGSEKSDQDGAYFIRVAGAGTYYLRVREVYGGGPVEGANMLAYGGASPQGVTVKEGEIVRGINLTGEKFLRPAPAALAGADEKPAQVNPGRYVQTLEGMPIPSRVPAPGTLKGLLQTTDGRPLAGGEVYFFNDATGPAPAPENYWRVPDEIAKLDDKGGFIAEIPPGRYFIGAIRRNGVQTTVGPPSEGDLYYVGNKKYDILTASENTLEVIREAKPFTRTILAKGTGSTAIEGIIFDSAGKPVENVIVFAYTQSTMNDKPLYVSERTGRDGAFRLRVGGAGSYYLRIRDIYGGGAPLDGAFMGAYGGDTPKAVTLKDGEIIRGIILTGEKFVRPIPGSQ